MAEVIRSLSSKIGGGPVDFEIDRGFADDLPVQILCRSCGQHLLPAYRTRQLEYQHPRSGADCVAPTLFAIGARDLLALTLRVVLVKAPADFTGTVFDLLRRYVLHVLVDPRPGGLIEVYTNDSEARAA
jgi:hypothetical protein